MIWLAINAVGLALTASVSNLAVAQEAMPGHPAHAAGHDMMMQMAMPESAQDHRTRAEMYEKKAAENRSDIAAHKKMLADYSKTVAVNAKTPTENPYIKNMRLHCENYIKAAEALAHEDDEMAKLHTMRAKETDGK